MTTQHWASLAVDPRTGDPVYDLVDLTVDEAHGTITVGPGAVIYGHAAAFHGLRVLVPQRGPRGLRETTLDAMRSTLSRLTDPRSGIRDAFLRAAGRASRPLHRHLFVLERNRFKVVEPQWAADTFAQLFLMPDTFEGVVEVTPEADQSVEQLVEAVHQALRAVTASNLAIRDRLSYTVEPATDPSPPAVATRDALLALGWPASREVGIRLGSAPEAAEQRASRERAGGRLLGAWDTSRNRFVHPPFQFLPDGRLHPRLAELLAALADLPGLNPAEDRGGWGRTFWLYQPRGSLSERSVAEAGTWGAPDANWDAIDALPDAPRTPAEVFVNHPDAVIALVRMDAGAGRAA